MRIAVIGGGIYGAAIAYFLERFGDEDVLLFEADSLGGVSTSLSAGIIRHHYSYETHMRVVKRSRELFEDLETYIGRSGGFHQNGFLAVVDDDNEQPFREIVRLQQRIGLDVDLLQPDQLAEHHPQVSPDGLAAGAIEHEAGFADPYQVAVGFAEKAAEMGTDVMTDTAVTDLETDGSDVTTVRTDEETFDIDYVVNAAGSFGGQVAAMAGVDLPVTWKGALVAVLDTERAYSSTVPTFASLHNGWYAKPEPNGGFVVGGFDHNQVDDPADGSGTLSNEQLLTALDFLEHRFPGYRGAEVTDTWTGLITMTPDTQQIFGTPPGLDNLYLAIGGNGHGFKEGPGFAESIAQKILGREPRFDLSAYRLSRFEEGDTFRGRYETNKPV